MFFLPLCYSIEVPKRSANTPISLISRSILYFPFKFKINHIVDVWRRLSKNWGQEVREGKCIVWDRKWRQPTLKRSSERDEKTSGWGPILCSSSKWPISISIDPDSSLISIKLLFSSHLKMNDLTFSFKAFLLFLGWGKLYYCSVIFLCDLALLLEAKMSASCIKKIFLLINIKKQIQNE